MNMDPKKNDPPRKPNPEDPNGKRTKSVFTVIIFALILVVVINWIYTGISNSYLKKITYSEFEELLAAGQLAEVEFEDDQLLILTKEEAAKESPQKIYYYTGLIPNLENSDLIKHLKAQDVKFDGPITEKMSPIMSALISWVLLFIMFYLIISLFMGSMAKRMGTIWQPLN